MENVLVYNFNIAGDFVQKFEQINDGFDGIKQKAEETTGAFEKLGKFALKANAIPDFFGKLSDSFQSLVGPSLEFEQQMSGLKTLMHGDAEAAERLSERLKGTAAATLYGNGAMLEAQKTMMSFGLETDFAFQKLQNIGDIAMGDKEKMQSLTLAFAQASSTGKLMGQDFLQMVNAGFNPLETIAQKTGRSIDDLKVAMSKGEISAELLAQAFQWATEEGGLFYQGAQNAADTTAGRIAKVNAKIDDMKIALFNATGGLTAWIAEAGKMAEPFAAFIPILAGTGKLMLWIKGLNWAGMWSGIRGFLYASRIQMMLMNRELVTGQFASNGFMINVVRATLAVLRFATVGIFQALKGLGFLILSFVTGGTASATFAGIASTSFGAFKLAAVTACRAVGTAIKNIPVIGWIVAVIAALAALGVYFWNTSTKFRAVLKGIGAAFVATFKGIWDLAKNVFGSIGDLIKAAFSLDADGIKKAVNKLKGGFSDFGKNTGKAFLDAYNAEMEADKKAEQGSPDANLPDANLVEPPNPTGGTLASLGSAKSDGGGGKVRNVTVNVDRLVERFEIHTTNLSEDLSKVKDMVGQALLAALNDVNLAT